MDKITAMLGNSVRATEIRDLWLEYEAAETKEAKLVKDLDKFEMICQAFEYEQSNYKNINCGRT